MVEVGDADARADTSKRQSSDPLPSISPDGTPAELLLQARQRWLAEGATIHQTSDSLADLGSLHGDRHGF